MYEYILYFFFAALAISWFYVKYHYTFWDRNGFPTDRASKIPFGCLESVSKHEKSMGMAIYDVYLRSKEPFIGLYLLFRPGILVRDLDLVRNVLAQDFDHFHDRGVYVDEENDPLSGHLFALRGQSWRSMRQKLAPSFTSGKLKAMFATSNDIGDKMVDHLKTILPTNESKEIDLKEVLTTYAVDIIASVIFGLDINSFDNPKNEVRALVRTARRNTLFTAIFGMLIFLCPSFAKFLFRCGIKNEVGLAVHKIIKKTVKYREGNNVVRKDMLQLLMQLRNSGKINEDDNDWDARTTSGSGGSMKSISLEAISAQALLFYIAGQETTASSAAFTLFELAQYPDLLVRVQREVEETLKKHNGQITYEALKEMEFLELCLLETLRKYPGLPMLNRECTMDYQIPGTDKIIPKGTPIVISLFGLHRDPEYFPEPDKYDPERFDPTNMNYNPKAFMPFGEGPRHCIAQRMGRINAKLAVVKILQNFNIEIMEKQEIEFENFSLPLIPKHGVKVRMSRKNAN